MDITTFDNLLTQTEVITIQNGLKIKIPQAWIIKGERRLSYTTLLRLTECCREYHWQKDIISLNNSLDSICGQINANFLKPIQADQLICITYEIRCVLEKKYILDFYIYDSKNNLCGYVDMVSYFYEPHKEITVFAPKDLHKEVKIL